MTEEQFAAFYQKRFDEASVITQRYPDCEYSKQKLVNNRLDLGKIIFRWRNMDDFVQSTPNVHDDCIEPERFEERISKDFSLFASVPDNAEISFRNGAKQFTALLLQKYRCVSTSIDRDNNRTFKYIKDAHDTIPEVDNSGVSLAAIKESLK
jgi:hypothetical protein